MKKVVLLIAVVMAAGSLQAQNTIAMVGKDKKEIRKERHEKRVALRALEGREVSYQSKEKFAFDFGNVQDVQWVRSGFYDEATFTNQDGRKTTAYYDITSQLVGTTSPREFSDLPMSAQKYIKKHYQNYEGAPVLMFDDNEANDTDMLLYGTQFDDEDIYFIEVRDGVKTDVLRVALDGTVALFRELK
ncbi:hypothetical protein AAHN97_04105 [Chitinophaga niabensis]|uniref:hypothetical protein n=1 Tax=Chitinophaga niabensis TaxID=536979 RepID=UPI0031BA38D7